MLLLLVCGTTGLLVFGESIRGTIQLLALQVSSVVGRASFKPKDIITATFAYVTVLVVFARASI
jgi:hypothetical protein